MSFNFGLSAGSVVRNTRTQLKPWNIYDVKFVGVEARSFAGKKDPNATYKVFDIKFESEDGYFNKTIFYPKDGDTVRRSYNRSNGSKGYMPSNFESLIAIIHQTVQVLCGEEGYTKFNEIAGKCKDFDTFLKAFIQITDRKKGVETKLKLIGRNRDGKVVADIPNIVAINPNAENIAEDSSNDSGERFISDNYIGNKLFFSDYEEREREKYLKAKPAEMKAEDPISDISGIDESDDNFNLDSLL